MATRPRTPFALLARVHRFVLFALLAACSTEGVESTDGGSDPGEDAAGSGSDDAPPATVTCSGKTMQPRDATWTVGGRMVRVHVPASYDPVRPTPVVFNLHGYSGDGLQQSTISKMIPVSDANGFIVLHPDGHHSPRGWNGGVCCGAAASSGTDDVAWLASVLDEAESKLCVDTNRVFATGLSNGGFMTHRLACEIADRIAAIAPVAGVVGITGCNPSRPVAVMHIHGDADPLIPYGGGGVNGNESVAATIERWATKNGCTGAPAQTFQQGDATCTTRSGCNGGADVVECRIAGGGHQWPGGVSIGSFLGELSNDLDASNAMWAFFAAHPRTN
jgi:polyhydroxybutyrate depolymerase